MEHETVVLVALIILAGSLAAWVAVRRRLDAVAGLPKPHSEPILVDHVTLAVNPRFPRWVLFANGTYVIVEKDLPASSARTYALEQMRESGPVHPGSPAGDFSVIVLDNTDGWSVSGHGFGMYTYVHPSELASRQPSDVEVGLFGRRKRAADADQLRIIRMNGWE